MKTAYSKMLREYRRYARHTLMMPVAAFRDDDRPISLTVVDVGYGGVGLETKEKLQPADVLSFRFLLPGGQKEIAVRVRVLWTRDSGRAGCEFVLLPPSDLMILDDWLMAKTQVKKPLVEVESD